MADGASSGPTGRLPAEWPGPHLPNFPIPEFRVCSNNELVSFQQSREYPDSGPHVPVLVNAGDAARGTPVLEDGLAGTGFSGQPEGGLRSRQEGLRAVGSRLGHDASRRVEHGCAITAAELSGRPRCPEAAQLLGANGEDLATTQDGPDDRAVPMTSVVAAPPPEKAGRDDNGRLPSHHWMSGGGTGGSGPRTTTRRPSTASRPSAKSWIAVA